MLLRGVSLRRLFRGLRPRAPSGLPSACRLGGYRPTRLIGGVAPGGRSAPSLHCRSALLGGSVAPRPPGFCRGGSAPRRARGARLPPLLLDPIRTIRLPDRLGRALAVRGSGSARGARLPHPRPPRTAPRCCCSIRSRRSDCPTAWGARWQCVGQGRHAVRASPTHARRALPLAAAL